MCRITSSLCLSLSDAPLIVAMQSYVELVCRRACGSCVVAQVVFPPVFSRLVERHVGPRSSETRPIVVTVALISRICTSFVVLNRHESRQLPSGGKRRTYMIPAKSDSLHPLLLLGRRGLESSTGVVERCRACVDHRLAPLQAQAPELPCWGKSSRLPSMSGTMLTNCLYVTGCDGDVVHVGYLDEL